MSQDYFYLYLILVASLLSKIITCLRYVYITRRNETIYTYYLINDHSIINEWPMNIMKLLVCFRDQMLLPWLTLVQYSYGSELNLTINECRGHLIQKILFFMQSGLWQENKRSHQLITSTICILTFSYPIARYQN